MSIEVTYRCNGCASVETVTGVKAERVVLTPNVFVRNGLAYDKTRVERPSIESVAPEGWIVWDPYTQMTYCPACWASIENGACSEEQAPDHQMRDGSGQGTLPMNSSISSGDK